MTNKEKGIADREARLRGVNERVKGSNDAPTPVSAPPSTIFEFSCECGRDRCDAQLPLTAAEYESVRRDSAHFVVAPGHEMTEAERVVARAGRFLVVEKVGNELRDAVHRSDPRS